MANSEIKVGLKFSADVSRAKQDIKSLESAMSDLMTSIAKTDPMDSLTDGLGEARESAQKLQAALQQSVNIKTGQFDLSKFSKTLKDYGTNLKEVSANLQKLGPEGEAAFNSLTSSIVSAEIPAKKVNKTFAEFTKQLKNVARYQISTKIYNELVGSLEQAWIYAKNLNKSLNDIRIVTGYNVDDMAQFAEKANAAARALSSTTNEYAKASLIYFQQGLSDAEVEQRTATTIKLANVTGQSAQEVSEYMTAVWNNFDDGTKSLEYYADAITKLGAATASSSEEIATGLQKFSAVAQSVGLSYEYATSMLATVTSQTRESAETVGTSFKTILARLESLSLGETLDDATTMTKYSQALAKVGVSIKDQTDALKDMDTIIQEIGETWKTISADQRIALAQTVAGMRQYNNFIALMDNYDTFQMNVQLATDSEGSLQEQADIYAESWEAATKRVEAAAEELYDKLINDEFFIDLLNITEKLINGFSDLIDTMGGVPGLLTTIGFILTKVFSNQISAGIVGFTERLSGTRKEIIKMKEEAASLSDNAAQKSFEQGSSKYNQDEVENTIRGKTIELQLAMAENEDYLTESQKARLQVQIDQQTAIAAQVRSAAELSSFAERELALKKEELQTELALKAQKLKDSRNKQAEMGKLVGKFSAAQEGYSSGSMNTEQFQTELVSIMDELREGFDLVSDEGAKAFSGALKDILGATSEVLLSSDQNTEEALKKSLSDSAIGGQAIVKDVQSAQASQLSRETGLDYSTSLGIVKESVEKNAPIYSQEFSNQLAAQEQANRALENYQYYGSDEFLSKKSNEAQQIIDKFAQNESTLEEFKAAIDKFSEGDEETKASISLLTEILEQTYEEAKSMEENLDSDAALYKEHKGDRGQGANKAKEAAARWNAVMDDGPQLHATSDEQRKERQGKRIRRNASELKGKVRGYQDKQKAANRTRALEQAGGGKKAEEALDQIDAVNDALAKQEAATKRLNVETEKGINITKERMSALSQGFTNAIAGTLGMLSALRNLSAQVKTLFLDSDQDFGEKFTSFLTFTLTTIPMVITSLNSLIKIKDKDKVVTLAQAAAQGISKIAAGATIVINKLLGKSISDATKAKWAENTAWYASPILWIPLVIAAAVAAIALLVVGIKSLTKNLSASAKAAKELEEARDIAKSFEEELAKVTAEAQELKESFDKYDTIRDKLDSCVYGTKEWNEALSENNAQVLELLDKYPELASMVKNGESAIQKNASGALTVADWAMEDLENQADSRVQHATVANIVAKQNVREKEIELQKSELKEAITSPSSVNAGASEYIADRAIEDIVKTLEENPNIGLEELKEKFPDYKKLIEDNSEKIISLKDAVNANTVATQAESEVIKQTLLADNETVQNSKYEEYIKASTQDYNKILEQKKKDNAGLGKDKIEQISTEDDKDAIKAWEKYLESEGLSTDDYVLTGVIGDDDNREFEYKVKNKETGEWDKGKTVSADAMQLSVATSEANKAMVDEAEKIAKEYAGMTRDQVAVLTAARSGDTSYMSYGDFQKYYTNTDVINALANKTDDPEMAKKIQEALTKGQTAFSQVQNAFGASTHMSFSELSKEAQNNLSINAINSLNQSLSDLSMTGGTDMAANFMEQVDVIMQQYPDKVEQISALVGNIDWSQGGAEALVGFTSGLKEIGVVVNTTNEDWAAMAEKVNGVKKSIEAFDLNEVRKELATVQKLASSIKLSDVISDQEFETLRKYSSEVDNLFIKTANGYQFIGKEASQLGKITTDTIKQQIRDQMKLLDSAEKGAKTNRLNQEKSNNDFEDMVEVATSDTYAAFREAYSIDADKLAEMGKLGLEAQKKLNEGNLSEADRLLYEDQLKKSQLAADDMYAKAQDMSSRDYSAERQANAEIYASTYGSVTELEADAAEFEGNPFFEEAYKKQLEYLQELAKERLANLDLYQDESKALENLAQKQEDLADAKEHATGQDYLNLLKEEIALEKERAKVYESGLSEAKGQQQRASKGLNEILGDANAPKAKLDENGNITNWEELDRYMASAKVNDDQRGQYEEYKVQVQSAEDKVTEYTENIKDSEKAQRSMWIESATYAAEYNETIRDMELEWLEFQLGAVEDAEFSAAMGLANLSNKTRLYAETARDTSASLNQLAKEFGVAPRGENESMNDFLTRIKEAAPEAEAAIQDIMSGYMEALQQAREADKELANSLVTHFEQVGEKFDKVNEQIGIMQNTASNYKNIIDLVGKENFDNIEGTLSSLNKMEQNMATSSLKTSKAKAETLTKDIAYAEEKINAAVAAGDMGTAETWRKTWETLKDQQQSAVQEMQESWTSALETAAAVFEESTARVLDTFEKSMSGTFGSFDRMSEVFGQQSTLNNQYVADYKKVYELSKLTRNIQQTIDNSDSVAAKKEMRQLQEEITQLQESGTEMSQYDLDYLQKKYDLRVAEIALEEAQNAKSQVRLQKMSNGSWGYVYTQNADAVANAQQNYEDKMFALQELSTNYLDTTSEQIIATQAEFQSAIETIMTSGLSDEEKKKQVDETVAYYQERLQFLTSEFDGVIENNQGMANMVQSFSESLLGAMYPAEEFDSADNIFAQFNEQVGDWESGTGLMGGLKTALTDFQSSTAEVFKEAGYSSMEEFISALNTFSTGGELSETMATLFNEDGTLKEGAIPGIDNIVSSVTSSRATLQETYKSMYQDYIDYLNSMSQAKIDADGNVVAPELEFTSDPATPAIQMSRAVAQGSERLYTYDTGGYTGSWGSEGKLAVLHEKELVLNKEDTSNLLHTMEIMDQLIKSIDLSAAAARMTNISAARISGDREALQQEVTIHAEFPNATDSSQIEAALNSLVNRAAQYANRNR